MRIDQDSLFLTGLRGYAALAVFIVHAYGTAMLLVNPEYETLAQSGRFGVIYFFIVSALTLCISIDNNKHFRFSDYMWRRFSRIAPLYYVVCIVLFFMGGNRFYQKIAGIGAHDPYNLFMHLSFMNLWDWRYQNTLIGVEWSVSIEMWTYLFIPALLFVMRKFHPVINWALVVAAAALSVHTESWYKQWYQSHWAALYYTYAFMAGIVVYLHWRHMKLPSWLADILVIICLGVLLWIGAHAPYYDEKYLALAFCALVLLLINANYMRVLFENRLIVGVGNMCFPIYLLHMPILSYVASVYQREVFGFIAAAAMTLALAYLCHMFIERPALRILTRKPLRYDF